MTKKMKKAVPMKFSKNALLEADIFTKVETDFLAAYLADGELYTIEAAQKILQKQLKGDVK